METVISGIFVALIVIWIAAKMLESSARSTARAARRRAEATRDNLYVQRVNAANEMSRQDLDEFEEWKRWKTERG